MSVKAMAGLLTSPYDSSWLSIKFWSNAAWVAIANTVKRYRLLKTVSKLVLAMRLT
jgi:hypothetical protein